jgi:hypothetical protein
MMVKFVDFFPRTGRGSPSVVTVTPSQKLKSFAWLAFDVTGGQSQTGAIQAPQAETGSRRLKVAGADTGIVGACFCGA